MADKYVVAVMREKLWALQHFGSIWKYFPLERLEPFAGVQSQSLPDPMG